MKKVLRRIIEWICLPILHLFAIIIGVPAAMKKSCFANSADIPKSVRYCLIPGANLFDDDRLTPILQKRLDAAIQLYKERPDLIFILSGDGTKRVSNDVQAMFHYLKANSDIPDAQILLHNDGLSTLDSMRFITPEMDAQGFILLTSAFHVPRCVYICHKLALQPFALYLQPSRSSFNRRLALRESFALVKTWYVLRFGPLSFGHGLHLLLFRISFLIGKLTQSLFSLFGRRSSSFPGRIAVRMCPYLFMYLTKPHAVIIITGSAQKEGLRKQILESLRAEKKHVLSNQSDKDSVDDIASALLSQPFFPNRHRETAVVLCVKTDQLYKVTRYITSENVSIVICDTNASGETPFLTPSKACDHLLSGLMFLPDASVYVNASSSGAADLANKIPQPITMFELS